VGSTSGKIAYQVLPGLRAYTAKAVSLSMTKQIAMEGGKHVSRCNTISPGLVLTNQTRDFINMPEWFAPMKAKLMLGRVGVPEDIAPLAVYLASDESTWVNGATLQSTVAPRLVTAYPVNGDSCGDQRQRPQRG